MLRVLKQTPRCLILASLLAGCSEESANNLLNSLNNESTVIENTTLTELLITDRGADFYEAWSCFYAAGEPAAFLFYDRGEVAGFEDYYLGMELSVRPNQTPFSYTWAALSQTSIALQSPPQGVQDVWTDIRFNLDAEPSPLMQAVSESRGPLFCSLEGSAS